MAGRVIQVQRIPGKARPEGKPKNVHENTVDILAELCYFYPGYTLATAKKVPFRDVMILLKKARVLEAEKYRNLSQIVMGPHSKDGAKKLYNHYTNIINSF